jgi:hypothetical protein
VDLPSTPLRRLTRFEYENSVRDLLGVDTASVNDLPPDNTDGFDNNASLQTAPELLVEKYVLVSEALAALAVKNLATLTGCGTTTGEACAKTFAKKFGRKAFRRPLTTQEETVFLSAYGAGANGGSHAEGIEVMVRLALQSPQFLYRFETAPAAASNGMTPLNQYEIATRLAFFIWGTIPDDTLLDAAAAGQLGTKAQPKLECHLIIFLPSGLGYANWKH